MADSPDGKRDVVVNDLLAQPSSLSDLKVVSVKPNKDLRA